MVWMQLQRQQSPGSAATSSVRPAIKAGDSMQTKFTLSTMLCAMLLVPGVARASLPVSFTVIGCVRAGVFVSEKYTFNFGSDVEGAGWRPKSLLAYEGKTIRIDGMLSPGDHLNGSITLVDETCHRELHNSKFN
jgi:hypothetical protein